MTLWPRIDALPGDPPKRKRRATLPAALALLVSAGLHAAALAFVLDRLSRPGVDAETDAVSVEIVLDAPPALSVAASGGTPAAAVPEPQQTAGVESPPEAVRDEHAAAKPEENAPAEEASSTPPPPQAEVREQPALEQTVEPAPDTTPPPPLGQLAAIVPRNPVAELTPPLPASEPAQETAEASPPETAFAQAPPPEIDAPLPSPRPVYRVAKAKPAKRSEETAASEPAKKAAKAAPAGKAQASAKPAKREETARSSASTAGSASASAGAKAKYGQKLLSHVQRHKRYPEAAARQRITGETKLAITIDRSGALAGARVAGGSGHAVLDEAALAAARRAAPYPRPPEGVGGGTFSFAVTMRFKR